MTREQIDFVFTAPIGSELRLAQNRYTVVGKLRETYHPERSRQITAYVLSLSGWEEIGAEHRDDGWRLWHAAFRGANSINALDIMRSRIEETESGRIQRHQTRGVVAKSYPNYIFGKKGEMGIFMPYDNLVLEVWENREIKPGDIRVLHV
ncbi:MAG: hypothetical protein HYU56_02000 [Candidatus Aenigmarchaeota archaeon]|nr:hypothetical protein [Candidatus Aenigmarchaeota archaeon]